MRVLIIGSEGFIGSHLVQGMTGHDCLTADIRPSDRKDARHTVIESDDYRTLIEKLRPEVCINASGAADVAASFKDPDRDRRLNVENVRLMLDAIAGVDPSIRFINLSSAAVYGSPDQLPISEGVPKVPISPYGKHKLASEQLLSDYHGNHGIPSISLRIFSCYGEGQKKLILWDLYQKAKATNFETVELFGSGAETRDYIHVTDLARAMSLIVAQELDAFNGGAMNVAGGKETRIDVLAKVAAEAIDPGLEVVFTGQEHKGYPTRWLANVSKLRALGFEPSISVQEGVQRYYAWVKRLA